MSADRVPAYVCTAAPASIVFSVELTATQALAYA